jgi:hypothetical protein
MKVFIQNINGQFANINAFTACQGFDKKGYEIRFYENDQLPLDEVTEDTVVTGGIKMVEKALGHLNKPVPQLESIPQELAWAANRKVRTLTIKEAREELLLFSNTPLFIKPITRDHKLFTGQVWKNFSDMLETAHIPNDTLVCCSNVVNFVSEYRCYILNNEVVGIKHYKGDFREFPNLSVLDVILKSYIGPSAYGIDLGVIVSQTESTSNKTTSLVEINDGFALGCYGLSPLIYATMLETRWNEMMRA